MYKLNHEFLEEFKKGRIAVHCPTEEEAKYFCVWMHNCGLKWGESTDTYTYLTNTAWHVHKEETCYIGIGYYCKLQYYIKNQYEIVTYASLKSEPINLDDYITEDVDFTGCHTVIAEAIKQGKNIKCLVRDNISDVFEENKIIDYCLSKNFPYLTVDQEVFKYAVPMLKKKKYYKKASDIMKWLEDNNYMINAGGTWSDILGEDMNTFISDMWQFCGKEVGGNTWVWHPEWIEEK